MKFFDSPDMRQALKRYLRAQMGIKGIDYRSLSRRLAELGVEQKEGTLRNKVNKGTMGAQLLMYMLMALDIKSLELEQIEEILRDIKGSNAELSPQKSQKNQKDKGILSANERQYTQTKAKTLIRCCAPQAHN